MATLGNKGMLAAINSDNHEEHPKNNQTRYTNFPRIQEDYITQVTEEIEGKVTNELSLEFSRTENHSLGARSGLAEFFLDPQLQVCSGPVPETSRSSNGEKQETNKNRSQNDPHPQVGVSMSRLSQNFDPDETSYTIRKTFFRNFCTN